MAPPGFLVIERLAGPAAAGRQGDGTALSARLRDCLAVPHARCREALPRPPRRTARRRTTGAGRPPALLLGRDQAVLLRPDDGSGRASAGRTAAARADTSGRQFKALAIFGVIAPWFSFTVVFVLAGVGLHMFVTAALRKDWRKTAVTTGICLAWLISFAGCFLLSRSIMSRRDFLWVWWNFAFLPVPPRSLADASLGGRVDRQCLHQPREHPDAFCPALHGGSGLAHGTDRLPVTGQALVAAVSFCCSPRSFLALAASGLHQYPFHGRLLFALVPTFLLLLSEGVAAIGRRSGWLVTLAPGRLLPVRRGSRGSLAQSHPGADADVRFARRPQERSPRLPRIPAQSSHPPGPTQHLGSPRPRAARGALNSQHGLPLVPLLPHDIWRASSGPSSIPPAELVSAHRIRNGIGMLAYVSGGGSLRGPDVCGDLAFLPRRSPVGARSSEGIRCRSAGGSDWFRFFEVGAVLKVSGRRPVLDRNILLL